MKYHLKKLYIIKIFFYVSLEFHIYHWNLRYIIKSFVSFKMTLYHWKYWDIIKIIGMSFNIRMTVFFFFCFVCKNKNILSIGEYSIIFKQHFLQYSSYLLNVKFFILNYMQRCVKFTNKWQALLRNFESGAGILHILCTWKAF